MHYQTIDRILVKQWEALSEFDKKPYVEEAEMHDMQLDKSKAVIKSSRRELLLELT